MLQDYRHIKTGVISFYYQQGFFRKFSVNGNEIIRGIFPAVRDQDWGTVACIKSEKIEDISSPRRLLWEKQVYEQAGVRFLSEVTMDQIAENEWVFIFEGKADTDFLKNRIGWNVLLPVENIAGQGFNAGTSGKCDENGIFPVEISPFQPVKNIKNLEFRDRNGISVFLEFEGDIFEMEDQRNWTDASYKIYSTPLELPFPAKILAGETIRQSIRLRIEEKGSHKIRSSETEGAKAGFPCIGLNATMGLRKYPEGYRDAFKALNLQFLSIHLESYPEEELNRLEEHFSLCRALDIKTRIMLSVAENEAGLSPLLNFIMKNSGWIKSIEVFDADSFLCKGKPVENALKQLKQGMPGVKTGGGTFAYYAELNRADRLYDDVDYVAFSISPQVHAFDDLSIIENLEGISYVLQDANKKFELPVHVNALTLKQRMNFVSTSAEKKSHDSPEFMDKRQNTVFAALWLLGVMKRCSLEGCSSVSLFETMGKRGILDIPEKSENKENPVLFPVYFVIREILKKKDYQVTGKETRSEMTDGMHLSSKQKDIYWLWNYGNQAVQTEGLVFDKAEVFDFVEGRWKAVDFKATLLPDSWYQFYLTIN